MVIRPLGIVPDCLLYWMNGGGKRRQKRKTRRRQVRAVPPVAFRDEPRRPCKSATQERSTSIPPNYPPARFPSPFPT